MSIEDLDADGPSELPSTLSSYMPIIIPIILIGTQSVVSLVFEEGHILRTIFAYLGWPVIALSIGVWLAYRNIKSESDKEKAKDVWVESALKTSAMILVVTGLGGSLSAILRGTPAVDFIATIFTDYGLPTIMLPFVIGIIGNMITGSTTVGVITAASLVAPMLGTLGLSPEAATLAGASGSVIIKYVNSSYFWVCTSLSRLSVTDAVFSYGGATLVGGLVSFMTVCVLWVLGLI